MRNWEFSFVPMEPRGEVAIPMADHLSLYGLIPVPPDNATVIAIFTARGLSVEEQAQRNEQAELQRNVFEAAEYYGIPVNEMTQEKFVAYMNYKIAAEKGEATAVDDTVEASMVDALKEASEDAS